MRTFLTHQLYHFLLYSFSEETDPRLCSTIFSLSLSLSLCLFFFSLLYDARSPEPLNNSIPTSSRFLPRFILRQVLVSKAHDNFIPSRAFLVLPIHRIAWSFINPRCTLYLKKISIFPCERRVLLNLYIYTGCDNYLWMTTLLSSSFSSIKIQKNII